MKKKNNGNRLQTVGLLFVESKKQTNLQRRVRLPHLPPPSPPPPQHTYNSAFDIFENITMKFE